MSKKDQRYFINKANNIYRDRVSDFSCIVDDISQGWTIRRLEKIYDKIYIDEMQDLSGWDFNFVEKLFMSSIKVVLVGDPRQSTYYTTNSSKNKAKIGNNMLVWVNQLVKHGLCCFEERTKCYRSNQDICNFSDSLYPELKKTTSVNIKKTGCDGILYFHTEEKVIEHFKLYSPVVLRWNKRSNTMGFRGMNIGVSKGKTFQRVLIFPTSDMKEYLENKDLSVLKQETRSKLYVAVTRAIHSVGFVMI